MLPTMIAERQVVKKLDTLLCSQKGEEVQRRWLLPQKVHSHLIFFSIFICSFEIDHHNEKEFLGPITNKLVNKLILFVVFSHQMQAVIK